MKDPKRGQQAHTEITAAGVINRPGVAKAVPQKSSLLIDSVSESLILFLQIFIISLITNSKSYGAEILRECSPPTTCHMSRVTCHVPLVMCHMSCVTCNFFLLFLRTMWWRVEGLLSTGPTVSSLFMTGLIQTSEVKWNKFSGPGAWCLSKI